MWNFCARWGALPIKPKKPKIKMKTISIIIAAVLFSIGMALATGVEQNPIQALYALVCMGAASYLFVKADRKKSAKSNHTTQKVYDYQAGTFRDVA